MTSRRRAERRRRRLCPGEPRVGGFVAGAVPRLTCLSALTPPAARGKGSHHVLIALYFTAKDEYRSQVALRHLGVADAEAHARLTHFWRERLGVLRELLAAK